MFQNPLKNYGVQMTPGQMDARKRKMAKTIENPPNYLSQNTISDKKKWKNLKNDGLPRY